MECYELLNVSWEYLLGLIVLAKKKKSVKPIISVVVF
jgi:hypothetical protein